ncbi:hypothetical protein [Streptomyces sp. NRRL F-5123]|uniref:hypothetical protein n=1 Tax=Streptomyces sp. NRRL F-5123 TaxID=1463856 RepID=UPI000A7E45AF|nr:hypothetical protein [Streptomyces sp. NRRL F-5123]
MNSTWPAVDLDPVRRLRVMAAGLRAAVYAEDHVDAPFAEVWSMASDLPHELPRLVPTIREFRLVGGAEGAAGADGAGERAGAWAYGPLGHRAYFEVVLRPGWCLMQSKGVVGGMAAVPEDGGTRFAVLGAARHRALLPVSLLAARGFGPYRGRKMIERARRRTEARRGA